MLDRYETAYNIFNHDIPNDDRPLAVVAMHEAEDTCVGSLLYERMSKFADFQVSKYFGMSLDKFLEMPTHLCDEILRISAAKQKVEGTIANNALSQIETGK